jgi:hypothetical protein
MATDGYNIEICDQLTTSFSKNHRIFKHQNKYTCKTVVVFKSKISWKPNRIYRTY